MKKLIFGLFALTLLAFSFSVEAGQNLRQKDDGSAAWVREGVDGVEVERVVGAVYLNVLLEDVSTASTVSVAIPLTDSKVSFIQSTIFGDLASAAASIDFYIGTSAGAIVGTEVTNTTSRMSIAASGTTGDVDTFTPSSSNTIEKNQILFIHTDGGSTNDVDAQFTITVVPR